MTIFSYQALTTSGRLMTGTLEAGSSEQAAEYLREMNLTVNQVEKAPSAPPRTFIGRHEFILFNQQLASLTEAGIPLERGLRELAGDVRSGRMRRVVEQLADDLDHGVGIEQAIAKQKGVFPPLYGRILQAGVRSGRLPEMLVSLNRHLETSARTRRAIIEATLYPLVVFILAMLIFTGVGLLVVPSFREIFKDFGIALPAITKFFINLPDFIVVFWSVFAVLIISIPVLGRVLSLSPGGRAFKETVYLAVPVLGRLYRVSLLSRFADALAVIIGTGEDLPDAMRTSADTTGCELLKREADLVARQIEQGTTLAVAGQACNFIPRFFIYSMQLGAQRNELQDNLYGLSDMYDKQTHIGQARLQALLMPIMLITVGGFIALTVVALFMPLVTLVSDLSG
ncbi:MAG: type II secretion system F family protein [Sedimentisphaerales bacterium]|nr:type II secretion system F family protein [Sedimentisphaerales bacterium]